MTTKSTNTSHSRENGAIAPRAGLKNALTQAFTAHPAEAGENYWEHLRFTMRMAGQLMSCFLVMIVHGLLPFLFTHSASTRFKECQDMIQARRTVQGLDKVPVNDLDSAEAYSESHTLEKR